MKESNRMGKNKFKKFKKMLEKRRSGVSSAQL
uniref:Uncharacterized protein n=1 Tax=Anguilla anguilla TaxID=7936 RepID=A0A0E9VJ67_ANGAN